MRKYSAVIAILALCGCEQQAGDGYTFKEKQFTRTSPRIEIVEHDSLRDLRKDAPKLDGMVVMAWSEIYPDGRCRMHIVDPAVRYYPEYIGHELTHCVYGSWHEYHRGK